MPFLNDLIAKPFRYGGSGSDVFGCYSLAREVLRRYGIPLPYYDTSDFESAHDEIMRFQEAVFKSRVYPHSLQGKPEMPAIKKKDGSIMTWKNLASVKVLFHVYQSDDWLQIERPEEACLGIFNAKVLRSNIPHLSVFTTNCEFIHSCPPKGVQMELLPRSPWQPHLVSLHRYVGPRIEQ